MLKLTRRTAIAVFVGLGVAFASTVEASPIQDRDPGVDLCIVIKKIVNLREEPSLESRVLRKLAEGEYLVLLDRTPLGEWYNVIHVDSGDEGWIHDSTITIRYTNSPKATNPFRAEQVDSYSQPEIVVTNDSYKTLNLTVGSQKYSIPPSATRAINVSAGSYRYVASAPGVIPSMGTKEWEVGYRYTWRFWIVTR
jgi:uncharacterized protein YgiM (DUF1202 family)